MGEKEVAYVIPVAAALRAAGIACEIYPDNAKLKKQFEYADRKGIPFLAIVGDQEVADGTVTLKNLASGEQRAIAKEALAEALS
jgi:histidyl-tRNA synthetase